MTPRNSVPTVSAVVLLLVALAGIGIGAWVIQRPLPPPDTALANDLQYGAATSWPSVDARGLGHPDVRLAVVDARGRVLLRQHEAPTTDLETVHADGVTLPIRLQDDPGIIVGHLHYVDPTRGSALAARERQLRWTLLATVGLTTVVALAAVGHVQRRIVSPFVVMQRWATRVAHGDLDTPLRMDRANAFGAFTESFDLMRTELRDSRRREAETTEATRVLIAQLGHDIRTPLASLQAQAELLRLTEAEPARRQKLETITAKSHQIDGLLAELFSANRSELASLPVDTSEHTSGELADLVRRCGDRERLTVPPPPDALLSYDPRRLQQVVDNVLSNAHKYAGTPVSARWRLDDASLMLTLTDAGPGAPPGDVPTLLARGTRGGNAIGQPGQGLGLHIAATLMERMGGCLDADNTGPIGQPTGFAVTLTIPLA